MTLSSEQLEHESERTRAQLAETLEELRARLTPGQVVDQLVDYVREGSAGEFVRNLGDEVRRNPLPVTLIGAGIGWLMMANSRSLRHPREWHQTDGSVAEATAAGEPRVEGRARSGGFLARLRDRSGATIGRLQTTAQSAGDIGRTTLTNLSDDASGVSDAVGERAQTIGSTVADTAREATWRVSSAAGYAASTAASARDAAVEGSASIYRAATDAAHSAGDVAARASRNAEAVTRSFTAFCAEQPLVLAGLGLALGAAIGAALPASETENRLMGKTSGELKESAQERVSELYQKAQNVAQSVAQTVTRNVIDETAEAVGKAAEDEGLTHSEGWKQADDGSATEATTAPASS